MIYAIRNVVNGKRYIGQTIKGKNFRWHDHISSLRNKRHHSQKLQRAFDKYGEDKFTFEIVEVCEPAENNSLELSYIKKFDSFLNGYNMNEGGQPGKTYWKIWTGLIGPNGNEYPPIENLAEFCRKNNLQEKNLRQVFSGDKCSHKEWTVKGNRERKISSGNKGHSHSNEHKLKISLGLKKAYQEGKR